MVLDFSRFLYCRENLWPEQKESREKVLASRTLAETWKSSALANPAFTQASCWVLSSNTPAWLWGDPLNWSPQFKSCSIKAGRARDNFDPGVEQGIIYITLFSQATSQITWMPFIAWHFIRLQNSARMWLSEAVAFSRNPLPTAPTFRINNNG